MFFNKYLVFIPGIILLFLQLLGLINVPLLVILVFFTLLGQTFITPITFSEALSPFHKNRGAAGALYAGFQYLISFIVTAIISLFTIKGITILSVAYILLSLIGITVFYWLINNKGIKVMLRGILYFIPSLDTQDPKNKLIAKKCSQKIIKKLSVANNV